MAALELLMQKALFVVGIIIAIVIAAFMFVASDPDLVVRTGGDDGFRLIRCDDPEDFKESTCAIRFCKNELMAAGHIPPGYEAKSNVVAVRVNQIQIQVDGIIPKIGEASRGSENVFRCLVSGYAVDKIEVVSVKEWAERVSAGEWEF